MLKTDFMGLPATVTVYTSSPPHSPNAGPTEGVIRILLPDIVSWELGLWEAIIAHYTSLLKEHLGETVNQQAL